MWVVNTKGAAPQGISTMFMRRFDSRKSPLASLKYLIWFDSHCFEFNFNLILDLYFRNLMVWAVYAKFYVCFFIKVKTTLEVWTHFSRFLFMLEKFWSSWCHSFYSYVEWSAERWLIIIVTIIKIVRYDFHLVPMLCIVRFAKCALCISSVYLVTMLGCECCLLFLLWWRNRLQGIKKFVQRHRDNNSGN